MVQKRAAQVLHGSGTNLSIFQLPKNLLSQVPWCCVTTPASLVGQWRVCPDYLALLGRDGRTHALGLPHLHQALEQKLLWNACWGHQVSHALNTVMKEVPASDSQAKFVVTGCTEESGFVLLQNASSRYHNAGEVGMYMKCGMTAWHTCCVCIKQIAKISPIIGLRHHNMLYTVIQILGIRLFHA